MTTYSETMDAFLASAPDYCVSLADNWKQGRTAYGGLTTTLLLAAIQNDHPDLPPLRSIQVNFVGPAVGDLRVSHNMLRRGKNNVTFEARLDSELGAGTYGLITFGITRQLKEELDYPLADISPAPEELEPINWPTAPAFVKNFDRRLVVGGPANRNMENPELTAWCRHHDAAAREGLLPMLTLADSPPAAFSYISQAQALSSINWTINMLTDDVRTDEGWWLMRAATNHIKNGFSSQTMQVWDRSGRRVMEGLQHQALFQ